MLKNVWKSLSLNILQCELVQKSYRPQLSAWFQFMSCMYMGSQGEADLSWISSFTNDWSFTIHLMHCRKEGIDIYLKITVNSFLTWLYNVISRLKALHLCLSLWFVDALFKFSCTPWMWMECYTHSIQVCIGDSLCLRNRNWTSFGFLAM